jgi:hypothetical protein
MCSDESEPARAKSKGPLQRLGCPGPIVVKTQLGYSVVKLSVPNARNPMPGSNPDELTSESGIETFKIRDMLEFRIDLP